MLFEEGHGGEHGTRLGEEYLINQAGYISAAQGAAGGAVTHSAAVAPPHSLVAAPGSDLEINLVWDASVAHAPKGFKMALVDAAELYAATFPHPAAGGAVERINIAVGFGEIAGGAMAANALGESESFGYLAGYGTVTHALARDGYSFRAVNEPTHAQFFVSRAEAKSFGLLGAAAGGADGFVGFSTLSGTGHSWNLSASLGAASTGTGPRQYDLEAVAWHEISEVMGRIGIEGGAVNGAPAYTPLDLFNFRRPGLLALSPASGHFSLDNGVTSLGHYNRADIHGGDIADWASNASIAQSATFGLPAGDGDAFDAFGFFGVDGAVSASDLAEIAALGFGSLAAAKASLA